MRLTFEYTKTAGTGFSPQAVHMMDNGLRFIVFENPAIVAGFKRGYAGE